MNWHCLEEVMFAEGIYLIVVNGIPRNWSPEYRVIAAGAWFLPLHLSIFMPPIDFIFRYFLVVR